MRKVRFLELHTDLFHAGTNLGKKIRPQDRIGMDLYWDSEEKWFEIHYKGRVGYIFTGNCAFWEPEEGEKVELPKNEHKDIDTRRIKSAQVQTPTGHVFEGLGKGKKRDTRATEDI